MKNKIFKYNYFFLLITVIIAGIFLRIIHIGTTFYFEGELGKEMLYLRQFYLSGSLPLIGMATSHEWLSYGPFYYWIMLPFFALSKGDPYLLFWTAAAVSVIGLLFNYKVVCKIANKKIALISTLIQAISPLLIWQTRNAKLHTFFFILSPLFMYSLYQLWLEPANAKALARQRKWVFWSGIIYGLMFSFHFSQIPLLLVVIILLWIKKKIYKWIDWFKFGIGMILPNITYILSDLKLFIWLPYRTLNIADKNPNGTINALTEYFGRNMFWNNKLWPFALVICLIIFGHYIIKNRSRFSKDFLTFYSISSISIMLLANVVHGAPPVHYFLPIFTTVPLIYSIYLSKIRWGILLLIGVILLNLKGYLNPQKADGFVSYDKLLKVTSFIVSNSDGSPFTIKRVGPYDYFPENYSQNYKYLILWQGGNINENSPDIYTIVENEKDVNVQK